ncbi:hypothetical protein ACTSKR_03670 [Chitinibacteraceae bacterium HSL-7]
MATARELEALILEKEEVVVIIRTAPNRDLGEYNYERKAAGTASVSDWVEQRLKPALAGADFTIISGDYTHPHGRTKMSTLRAGYEK